MNLGEAQNPAKRFHALDGLRGILALTVMLNHMIGVVTGWSEQRPLIGAYTSVIYFFIMSGFVLTYAHKANDKFIYFFFLRLARLWPLHFFATTLMILIYAYNSKHMGYVAGRYIFDWKVIFENLTFLHGVTPHQFPLINDPSWSISIEFWGSLLIPLLFIKISPFKRLLIAISLIILLCIQSAAGFVDYSLGNMFQFLLASAAIMLGSAVYSLATPERISTINSKNNFEVFLWICLVVCLIGVYGQAHNKLDYLFMIPFIPLMLIDLQPDSSYIKKFFHSQTVQFFGFISFPLYLLHSSAIIIGLQYRSDHPILSILMAAGMAIVISYIYAAFCDIPLYRYLKNKIKKFTTSPTHS